MAAIRCGGKQASFMILSILDWHCANEAPRGLLLVENRLKITTYLTFDIVSRCYKCLQFGHYPAKSNKQLSHALCEGDSSLTFCSANPLNVKFRRQCASPPRCSIANVGGANHKCNCIKCPTYRVQQNSKFNDQIHWMSVDATAV